MFIVVALPTTKQKKKKTAFLDESPLCPQGAPRPSKAKILFFIVVWPSLRQANDASMTQRALLLTQQRKWLREGMCVCVSHSTRVRALSPHICRKPLFHLPPLRSARLTLEEWTKGPTPTNSVSLRKLLAVLLRADLVLTKNPKWPYEAQLCGELMEGSCSKAAGGP